MEAENNMDDLLVRYLFNESGSEEILFVRDWINKSEENKQYFEGLKKTFGLLALRDGVEKINVDDEWKHLQSLIARQQMTPAENDFSAAELPEWDNRKRRNVSRLLIPAAAAAAIIIALLAGGGLFNNDKPEQPSTGRDTESIAKINPANAVVQHESNVSGKIKTFALPDGTNVRLSDKSEITYSEPAGGHKRNVVLKGEADFAVAKDKTKLFTVYSDDISTMAVGTRFTVTSFEEEKFIQVKLEEGKVLVKSERTVDNKLTDDYYLLPGQKLIYDKRQQTAKIRYFGKEEKSNATDVAPDNTPADNPLLTQYNKQSWFMFNNQSLVEIFHSLELMYEVKIVYNKKDVDQRYFIGTFSKSDSVENILQQIAVLNKLTVTRKDNSFIISKNK